MKRVLLLGAGAQAAQCAAALAASRDGEPLGGLALPVAHARDDPLGAPDRAAFHDDLAHHHVDDAAHRRPPELEPDYAAMEAEQNELANPMAFGDLCQEFGHLFDFDTHEGVKVDYQRKFGDGVLFHSLALTPAEDQTSNYSLAYQQGNMADLIAVRLDSNYDFFMRVKQLVSPINTLGFTVASQEGSPDPHGSLEADFVSTSTWAHVMLLPTQGAWRFSYHQQVSRGLSLGTELEVVEMRGSCVSFGGRYTMTDRRSVLSAILNPSYSMLQVNFMYAPGDGAEEQKAEAAPAPSPKSKSTSAPKAKPAATPKAGAKPALTTRDRDEGDGLFSFATKKGAVRGDDAPAAEPEKREVQEFNVPAGTKKPGASIGTELVIMPTAEGTIESSVKLAAKQKIGNFTITSKVDTNFKVATSIEHPLGDMGQFGVVGSVDHKEQLYKFGVQLQLMK